METQVENPTVTRIRELAEQFRAAQQHSHQMMEQSLHVAWRLGDVIHDLELEVEQDEFHSILAQVGLEKTVARKLVKYYKTTPADKLMDSRQGMLALGFSREKKDTPQGGDKTVRMLPHLSASVAAWARYVRAVTTRQLEMDPEEARRETREMFIWLQNLHGETSNG
jgi:hypothetical protein